MIEIFEICPPQKVSGLTSLIVRSEYSPDLVNALKAIPSSCYLKKSKLWEVSISDLAILLDSLTMIDDIKLELQDDNIIRPRLEQSEIDVSKPVDLSECSYGPKDLTLEELKEFKLAPLSHQVMAINYGLNNNKWLLLDDMGLGKTATLIYLAETLHKRGLIEHCFIVCGVNSLKSNWKAEIQKFSYESVKILGEYTTKRGTHRIGSVKDRVAELKNPIEEFFVITNIETLRSADFIDAFNSKKNPNKFGMIAVDEVHRTSNASSEQGHNLLKLTADYLVAATGTLITSNPINAYLPLHWLGIDNATLTGYKSSHCIFGGFAGSQVVGYKNLDVLQEEIDNCSVRRVKDQIKGLPEKSLIYELVDMSDEHRRFYDAIVDGVKEEVDKIQLNNNNLLALTTRLRQATACPGILTTNSIMSSKIERCVELAIDLVSKGEKVVVMSSFKEPVYQLAELLASYKPLVCTGNNTADEREANKTKFQTDPDAKIILCTHDSMGTGHTLNAAAYEICLDEKWNYTENAQSHDRIHRVNNERPAFIYTLICKDTIDERVHNIATYKKDLSEYIIDHKTNQVSKSLQQEMTNILLNL